MAGNNLQKPGFKPPEAFACPTCGADVRVSAHGQTMTVACGSCGTVIDATDKNHRIISALEKPYKVEPYIPLGTKGRFRGKVWEVIGFTQRQYGSDPYFWREFLLFNPKYGYRWLAESDGHWSFIQTIHEKPDIGKNTVKYKGRTFKIYDKYFAHFHFVAGEFYWRLKAQDAPQTFDYIDPPYILSCEKDDTEAVWSFGEYINGEEVQKAFGVNKPLRLKKGVAPHQPNPLGKGTNWIIGMSFVFFVVLSVLQLFLTGTHEQKKVFFKSYPCDTLQTGATIVTEPFKIGKDNSAIEIEMLTMVDNSWLEADITLVNSATEEAFSLVQGAEYYHGVDSDGSWSEGSPTTSKMLTEMKAGQYYMTISPVFGPNLQNKTFTIIVWDDVNIWVNYVLTLLFVIAVPIIVYIVNSNFEKERWKNSSFG